MTQASFDPRTDGFSFINYWTLDDVLTQDIRNKMNAAVDGVSTFLAAVPFLSILRPFILRTVNDWVKKASTQAYGLCGGMAFAALDYYVAGRNLPGDKGPTSSLSPVLRDYIVKRMKDSFWYVQDGTLHNNLARVLAWMAIRQYAPFGHGPGLLLNWSQAEFNKLNDLIARNGAWPIALIGESTDPCENHQVLAYECESRGEQGVIHIYDMNHPGAGRSINLNFLGPALEGMGEFAGDTWQPLRAFFCEEYSPAVPPL